MSTIKSSDEHLTLNADGSSKDIKFQANGVEKASISSAGAFTSTTIDATKLTGALPAISGAALTGVGVAGITSSADSTAMTITSAEKIGIGETAPLGQLHIKEQDSGVSSVSSNGDQLVLENSGHCGMHILSGTSSDGILYFGDSGGSGMGQLKYQHGSNQFKFETNQSGALTLTSDAALLLGKQTTATAANWNFDITDAGTISIGTNSSVVIGNVTSSGFLIINETAQSGQICTVITGGGVLEIVEQSGSIFAGTSSPGSNNIGLYLSGNKIYAKSTYNGTAALSVFTFRTRATQ